MPNYKELYYTLFRATERTINDLIEAQREAEERYLKAEKQCFKLLPEHGEEALHRRGNE